MVLAANFFQRIAKHLKEILVRVEDLAVQAKFDHRLDAIDRGELALLGTQFGDIRPFQDVAVIDTVCVVARANIQCEFQLADRDIGAERQPRRIRKHPPLMAGVTMKCVDAHANDLRAGSKPGQILRKSSARWPSRSLVA